MLCMPETGQFDSTINEPRFHSVQEPVYSLGELQSMLDGMMQDFASPQPAAAAAAPPSSSSSSSSSFFTGAGSSRFNAPSSGQKRRRSSSRVRPQGFGSSACFSRTAFSGC